MRLDDSNIPQPMQKAVMSLGLTGGAGVMAFAERAVSFLPDTALGWCTLGVALVAFIYNGLLLAEYFWKKWLRPVLRFYGFIKPGSFFLETDR